MALLLHVRTLGFGFTCLDDNVLIVEDQAFLSQPSSVVRSFGRTYFQAASADHAYYRPMINASYGLDANLGGASPRGYHATNELAAYWTPRDPAKAEQYNRMLENRPGGAN